MNKKYIEELKAAPNEVGDAILANTSTQIHIIEAGSTHQDLADQLEGRLVKLTPSGLSLADDKD